MSNAYQPFPVHVLPEPLRSYVAEGAAALGCDESMIALPCLSVVGATIGNSRTIKLKRSWCEPPTIWTAVISDSGTLKSPAFRLAVDGAYALERRLRDRHAASLQEYTAVWNQWKAMKDAGQEVGPEPQKPPVPRVAVNDCTLERLAQLLEENAKGLLLARDELSGWFKSFERYSKGSDMPAWLEFFNAGPLRVDRKTGEQRTLFVERASVCVCGTIQPSIFARAVRGEATESGLTARLLPAMPPRRAKVWTERDIDPNTVEKYEQMLVLLYDLEPRTDGSGRRVPLSLSLDRDAKEAWVVFYKEWAARQRDAEGPMAAVLSKLEGYAARFALMHHCVSRVSQCLDDTAPIRVESIEAGITLARWFANEAARVYGMFSESDEQRESRKLIEWIAARGNSCTARELQNSNGRRYPKVGDAETALTSLADTGAGHWETVEPSGRGRPTRRFVVGIASDTIHSVRHNSSETTEKQGLSELCRTRIVSDGVGDADAPDAPDEDYFDEYDSPDTPCDDPSRYGLPTKVDEDDDLDYDVDGNRRPRVPIAVDGRSGAVGAARPVEEIVFTNGVWIAPDCDRWAIEGNPFLP